VPEPEPEFKFKFISKFGMTTYIEMVDVWNKDPNAVYQATSKLPDPEDSYSVCPRRPEHFPDAAPRAQPLLDGMHSAQTP
jgi:hypothetical protein